jgi:tape measure domain-containing protein
MITEEIARITGKLVLEVDNRPLMTFQRRLGDVLGMLQQLNTLASKKFNIKVQLDSRTLREQLAKASNAKVTLKDVNVSQEALALAAKRISEKMNGTPITLNKIRVDIASLIETKKLVKTLLGQMEISIPLKFQTSAADKMLRAWKKETESKFKLKIDADISQHKFLSNVRKSLANASMKLGPIKIDTPNIKLKIDRDHLKQEIRDVLSQIRRETSIRVDLRGSGGGRSDRGARAASERSVGGRGMFGGGVGAAGALLGGFGGLAGIGHLNKINQEMQGQQNAMTAVMGSESAGQVQSKWVKDLSNQIGMDYRQVAPSYNKMLASGQTSGMSTESVQNIFQGVSEYGRTMGLDSESMKGSMKAIEQMMNKGQVMSEELKGQLAERMPGAMSAMAEAAGFGTDEKGVAKLMDAMKNGTVKSTAVLEKFAKILSERARQGGALEKAMRSTAAEQARMNNAFSDSIKIFSEGGFDKAMGDFFRTMTTGMEQAQPLIRALGGAFDILMRPINALILISGKIGQNWDNIANIFGLTGTQLTALAAVAAIAVAPFGLLALAFAGVALAIEDVMTYVDGGDSMFGRFLESSPEAKAALEGFTAEAKQFGEYLQLAVTNALELVTGLQGLSVPEMFMNTMRELQTILKLFNDTVDRFVAAGEYAQMMSPEGGVAANLSNMRAMANGPEWARQQMSDKVAGDFANQGVGAEIPGQISLTPDNIAEAVARAIAGQSAEGQQRKDYFEANINVDVKGGVVSAGDLMTALNEPMKQIAMKAFGDVVNNERNAQSQVRQ